MTKKDAISNLFVEALYYQKKNQLKKAEKIYNKILLLDPSHYESLNNLGILYFSTNFEADIVSAHKIGIPARADSKSLLGIL